jgi:pimeloyl-ACP methyl ester carboxylesterase
MFVLIHGGGYSSRCWEPVIPLLDAPALALDLPGRGTHPGLLDDIHLSDWIDSAVDDIARAAVDGAVLVGADPHVRPGRTGRDGSARRMR